MGNVIKFERKIAKDFDCKSASKGLIDFAESINDPNCDGAVDKILVIFRQDGKYGFGGWGKIDKKEKDKIFSELRKFFIDLGV